MRLLRLALVLSVVASLAAVPGAASASIEFVGGGVVRGDLGPAQGDPRAVAAEALAAQADRLGVDTGAFTFTSVRRSLVGTHIRGQQFRDGVAVLGSSAAVHIVDGRVVQVEATAVDLPGHAAARPILRSAAISAALRHVDSTRLLDPAVAQRLMVSRAGRLTDVWRVSVLSAVPAVAAAIDVSAATGRVLAVHDARVLADGTATAFDPNPVVSARNPALRQPGELGQAADPDVDSAELTAQLKTLPIKEYDATAIAAGQLSGPWVKVQGPGPLVSVPGATTFSFTRGDPRFETTMAYAHLDRVQRYFQSLGFTGAAAVNAEPQDVIALPIQGYDNSMYVPSNDVLVFGAGGVDDAEDAEVIVHEYGHAVQDAQVPGWGAHHEGGSMGEAFGDWLAGSFYARDISGGFQDTCIMDWDATSYSSASPPCLRRLDSAKRYPKDMENEVHADGEIWSAFLWRLREKLGATSQEKSDNSIKLVLTSHEFLTTNARFGHAVAALRQAADALGQPDWKLYVDEAAAVSGLPLNP
jgi:hypothetical protein